MSVKKLMCVALTGLVLGGCVSKVTEEKQFSGFLPSYAGLQQTKSASGEPTLSWVQEGFNPKAYDTIVFDQVVLYPEAKPSPRVSLKTLQEVQGATSDSIKNLLAKHYRVVSSLDKAPTGSKVLIMHTAITDVTAQNQSFKWYEVIPLAAINAGLGTAFGYRDQNAEMYLESDIVDAKTGLPMAKVVRKVFGADLENNKQVIVSKDFQVAIKAVMADMSAKLQ